MVQITQTGLRVEPGAAGKLAEEFARTGIALMPGFLAPPVLRPLLRQIDNSGFARVVEREVTGITLRMGYDAPAMTTLHFVMNTPSLFDLVSEIAGIPRPANFMSRLHRTGPRLDEEIDWHDDAVRDRILGLNVNLSAVEYTGGLLQLRDPEKRIRGEVGQLPAGDAFLFRIGRGWEHRLTPVTSGERTVAVGWFRSRPDWETQLLS